VTDNASPKYSITPELQSTLEPSGIGLSAMRNYIPCMAHSIQLALGVFISNLGVKGGTISWAAHECNQHYAENKSTDIGRVKDCEKRAMR